MLLVAEDVGARVELDLARAIAEVEERRLAVAAPGHHPPGDPVARVRLLPGLQVVVPGAHLSDVGPVLERVRERLHPAFPQAGELLTPLREQVRGRRLLLVAHGPSLTLDSAG